MTERTIFQMGLGGLFGGSRKIEGSDGKERKRSSQRQKELKKGTHVVPQNIIVYTENNNQAIGYKTQSQAYCDRLNDGKYSAVRLKQPLKVYRGEIKIISPGAIIYVHRSKLPKA